MAWRRCDLSSDAIDATRDAAESARRRRGSEGEASVDLHAIEQIKLWGRRRVDGVGRPKFDFHTDTDMTGTKINEHKIASNG